MSSKKRQIFAMGGGGFSMEPHNPLLDRYLLSLSEASKPKICFIGTASSDAVEYRERFYQAFKHSPCETSHIALSEGIEGLESKVAEQDIFYVGGGNTVKLLRDWKASKLDQYLRVAYERGAIMAGLSAGSICWFEQGLSDSVVPGDYAPLEALGWLEGSHCPHFDGESERQEKYKNFIINEEMQKGWAVEDGCALHFVDEELFRIVSSHPDKFAYQYSPSIDHPNQQGIAAGYLGGSSVITRRASIEELKTLASQHANALAHLQDPGAAENTYAFTLEAYGTPRAFAILRFRSEEEPGETKWLHIDPAIQGKTMEDDFRQTLKELSIGNFT